MTDTDRQPQPGSTLRERNWAILAEQDFDVLVVGGGINGAVCAAALSARGAKVALIDSRDFGPVAREQIVGRVLFRMPRGSTTAAHAHDHHHHHDHHHGPGVEADSR